MNGMENDAKRLAAAEASMAAMLKKVNAETAQVNKAVEDLKAAQTEDGSNFLLSLKEGGILKQGALVGSLLFSLRAVGDALASMTDPTHLTAALIQAGIAIVCAAVLLIL
jgi:hypothetical protein